MPILNYTSKIAAEKTVAEVQSILAKHGARKIVVDYDEQRLPAVLTFAIPWRGTMTAFSLKCNSAGVLAAMKRDKVARAFCTHAQATRTGWRIIKDWVAGQMAMVDAELMSMAEIFFSSAVTASGQTLFEYVGEHSSQLLLKAE